MKKRLIAFLLFLAICIFYLSVIMLPAGLILFILDPNIFYALIVVVAVVIIAAHSYFMKKKPWFGKLVEESGERIPPLPPV